MSSRSPFIAVVFFVLLLPIVQTGCVKGTASNRANAKEQAGVVEKVQPVKKSVVFLTDVSRSMKEQVGSMVDWLRAEPARSYGVGDVYRSVLLKGKSFDDRAAITLNVTSTGRAAMDRRALAAGVQSWQKNVDSIRSLETDDATDIWGAICKGVSLLDVDREHHEALYLIVMSDLKDNRRMKVAPQLCQLQGIHVIVVFAAHNSDDINDYARRTDNFRQRITALGAESVRIFDVAQTRAAGALLPLGQHR